MPVLNNEEKEAFLNNREIILRIAVTRSDNSPLVTPIWYLYEDNAIYFTPRQRSEWFACLRADPRVALCIDDAAAPYRKVVIEGKAELVFDVGSDDKWRDLYRRIASRYLPGNAADAYIQNTINEPRGLFRVIMKDAKVRSWRMPVAGESGEGIWHRSYYQNPDIKF
ncbi:MAG: pyridoxamine 5'-phosphate oxidase family protein [Pseudomonadales bacterium]|jgi:nitroimidazol reductase NimA-like FMN-containing flavoprotein (pyridoxamine 5'-phosphate oxidase superfamily)